MVKYCRLSNAKVIFYGEATLVQADIKIKQNAGSLSELPQNYWQIGCLWSIKDKFIEMDFIPYRGDAGCFTTGFMGDE